MYIYISNVNCILQVSPLLPSGALQTPPRQQPVAIAATPVATMHPSITPAAQAALAKFVTPKTKTPQQPLAPGSGNIKSVNQAVIAASVKRSAIKSSLAASRYAINNTCMLVMCVLVKISHAVSLSASICVSLNL